MSPPKRHKASYLAHRKARASPRRHPHNSLGLQTRTALAHRLVRSSIQGKSSLIRVYWDQACNRPLEMILQKFLIWGASPNRILKKKSIWGNGTTIYFLRKNVDDSTVDILDLLCCGHLYILEKLCRHHLVSYHYPYFWYVFLLNKFHKL